MTVYFPGWNTDPDPRNQVCSLPWDRLDGVNHAFWHIEPREGGFVLAPRNPRADTDPENPHAHFRQYAECAEKYPDKKILLSVGGWTDCGYFSEMVRTAESRGPFIRSCLETLEAYPFLSGLDIDWEYPGKYRKPADKQDEGNPVRGDDRTNYTLLLKELREALDARPGRGKILTVCAGAPVRILALQDYAALHPWVDRINLMTYDLAGPWNRRTGHHTALLRENSADKAVQYLLAQGVPAEKIAIGTPLYSRSWRLKDPAGNPVGAAAEALKNGGLLWRDMDRLEQAAVPEGVPGWHKGYDKQREAAWLWNDDPGSPDCGLFHSYESAVSLDAKLAYIRERGLGGLIVWEAHGDSMDSGWPMLTRIYQGLHS